MELFGFKAVDLALLQQEVIQGFRKIKNFLGLRVLPDAKHLLKLRSGTLQRLIKEGYGLHILGPYFENYLKKQYRQACLAHFLRLKLITRLVGRLPFLTKKAYKGELAIARTLVLKDVKKIMKTLVIGAHQLKSSQKGVQSMLQNLSIQSVLPMTPSNFILVLIDLVLLGIDQQLGVFLQTVTTLITGDKISVLDEAIDVDADSTDTLLQARQELLGLKQQLTKKGSKT